MPLLQNIVVLPEIEVECEHQSSSTETSHSSEGKAFATGHIIGVTVQYKPLSIPQHLQALTGTDNKHSRKLFSIKVFDDETRVCNFFTGLNVLPTICSRSSVIIYRSLEYAYLGLAEDATVVINVEGGGVESDGGDVRVDNPDSEEEVDIDNSKSDGLIGEPKIEASELDVLYV